MKTRPGYVILKVSKERNVRNDTNIERTRNNEDLWVCKSEHIKTINRKTDTEYQRTIRNIKELYPEAIVVTDAYTGTKLDRPGWTKLYKQLKPGDMVVFDQVSRMSRDADEGFEVYQTLYNMGVNLVFLKEPHINTETYRKALETGVPLTGTNVDYILEGVNKYLMSLAKEQIRLAFEQAQKEVEDLHQRTKEGIETARLAGKQIGQPRGAKLKTKKSVRAKGIIRKYSQDFEGTLSDVDVMKLIGCARGSYYKWKREMKEEHNDDHNH